MKAAWYGLVWLALAGCASQQNIADRWVGGINLGVQRDAAMAKIIAGHLYPYIDFNGSEIQQDLSTDDELNQVDIMTLDEIKRNFETGNLDVAVGLIEPIVRSRQSNYLTMPFYTYSIRYYIRSNDKAMLDEKSLDAFFSNVKSVGYVSSGSQGKVNQTILEKHKHAYSFVDCGSEKTCIYNLRRGMIAAIATTDSSDSVFTSKSKDTKGITQAKYLEEKTFGVVINRLTFNESEVESLNARFKLLSKAISN